jgi:hypothetical protein
VQIDTSSQEWRLAFLTRKHKAFEAIQNPSMSRKNRLPQAMHPLTRFAKAL